ncbi:hypothetical protein BDV93DRAFT_601948 [Ceratobasidium sp. AG-I]|nr:hypothetical protein BDV93DRAFT_601948 [Ceratobasidium sp. AG-I]
MGFCARCGELVSGQTSRCSCGGRPRNGSVQVSPAASKDGNTDRWSRTYTSKDKSPSPAGSPTPSKRVPQQRTSGPLPPLGMLDMDFNKDDDASPPPRTPPPSDALGTSHTNLAALPPVQRSPGRRTFPKPLNHSSRLGTRSTTSSRPSSPLKQAYVPPMDHRSNSSQKDINTDDDFPTIDDESELGDLTNTLGSTIQPKDTLPVQLCAGCETPFPNDAVRYPSLDDPRGITGVFYCRPCFKDNGGLKGHCAACGLEVLMGRHDGSSVTVRDKLFHSKCFKCTHCGSKVERGHSCDPAGKPCCEQCLEKVLNSSSTPTTPAPTRSGRRKSGSGMGTGDNHRSSARDHPRSSTTPAKTSASPAPTTPNNNRPRESMSFLEELKQRQTEGGGGTPSPSAIRRETLRSRSKSRDADRSRDTGRDREREPDRERPRERDGERRQPRDSSPISPINPDMIRRDTMGPRKAGSALRHRAHEREREREQSASPSPAAGRTSRENRDKPSPRSAMRSASRPRERSTSPPPQRSAKFADTPPLRKSTSKSALKQRERSVSPSTRRSRTEEPTGSATKPTPRSALRSSSRPRTSDPKIKRERERSVSPPPATSPVSSVFPVGKLTRDLGSLSIGLSAVDDSNVSTSDGRSSVGRSDWTALSSTSPATSMRSSMSPPSGSVEKPVLKTRRSATSLRNSITEGAGGSESPSTAARARRPIRSQVGSTPNSSRMAATPEPEISKEPVVDSGGEEESIADRSMDKEIDFKPTTPSRIPRQSIGRDSPATSTGTVTPSGARTLPSAPSSAKKLAMGDYNDTSEHRTSWLRNKESRTRSFVASAPRGDYSDASADSIVWSRRSDKLSDIMSTHSLPRPPSIASTDFEPTSPPPAPAPVATSTRESESSKRRNKVDDLVMPFDSMEKCDKCHEKLHLDGGNMFVTVPGYAKTGNTGEFTPSRTFHVDCFKCSVCELPFGGDAWEGQQARFVQLKDVIAHPECAPPIVRTATYTPSPTKTTRAVRSAPQATEPSLRSAPVISRQTSIPPPAPAPSAPAPRPRAGTMGANQFPRFGGSMYCPWCTKSVSPMEIGTCPGPNGSRWHSSCLVCGGKDAKKNRKNPKDPGCGKQLDSGAKCDQDGGVWCRECIDKLPSEMRPSSPIRPIVPTHTGSRSLGRAGGAIVAQYTGVSVHTTGGGILRPQTTGGGGIIRPQTTGGGGIIRPQTTGGGGIIRPQTTGGGGGILRPQTTGGGGILKQQTTGGGGILKSQTTGGGGYVRPQITGRSVGEVNPQYTGSRGVAAQYTGGSIIGGLVPQLTGGVPITMQLTGGMLRSRSPTKGFNNAGELEEQMTGSGRNYERPGSAMNGRADLHTAMSYARKGVSIDEPVRERPKSVYGTRNWKM